MKHMMMKMKDMIETITEANVTGKHMQHTAHF